MLKLIIMIVLIIGSAIVNPIIGIVLGSLLMLTIRAHKNNDGNYDVIWGLKPLIKYYKNKKG